MLSISPDTVDLAALPPMVAARIREAINENARETRRVEMWADAFAGSDAQLLDFAQTQFFTAAPPVTHAYAYSIVHHWQEIVPEAFRCDSRRPVIMRGSRGGCYLANSMSGHTVSPNGWAARMFRRALKASRKTLIYRAEIADFINCLAAHVARKNPGTTAHFRTSCGLPLGMLNKGETLVLMSGRFVGLPFEQFLNVERLFNIIRKTDKLDKRLDLARASKRY